MGTKQRKQGARSSAGAKRRPKQKLLGRDAPARAKISGPETALGFSIVGVGASAGGLEAFNRFLRALPADTGMAFVFVQHLSPAHESSLPEILARATSMPVMEVVNEPKLEPDHVYVIPPDRNMVIVRGHLRLTPREMQGRHHPIDQFFRSLAETQLHMAIGVVLSGTATDGTLGLEAIKALDGITFAQDESAQQQGMPHSAVASGCVDFVLAPEAIAAEIARIGAHPRLAEHVEGEESTADQHDVEQSKASLVPILRILRSATGTDFEHYKSNTLLRRVRRRMVLQKSASLEEYAHRIRGNAAEIAALHQDILINVTGFFRDPEVFKALKTRILPTLLRQRSRHDPLRVWVPACSTGEEAYSLAMILAEAIGPVEGIAPAQVFATDLNPAGIERARAGFYAKERLQEVSRERLGKFFVEVDGNFRVAKSIRDLCVFARHDVLADPPFSRMDLVSCRNLLIYLEPALQQRLIPILHYALKPKGFLVLGASETIGKFGDLFGVADVKHKIFASKSGARRLPLLSAQGATSRATSAAAAVDGAIAGPRAKTSRLQATVASSELHLEADRLLAALGPAAVLVDAKLEILQFRGNTEQYLAPAQGTASLSLLKMARPGLLVPLQTLLHRAKQAKALVRDEGLRIKSKQGYLEVDLEVLPVRGSAADESGFLVLFRDAESADGARTKSAQGARKSKTGSTHAMQLAALAQQRRLEHELASSRGHLQALTEQYEAANEELQSSNEEVQSSNEELQSINEELETSKEEIQSSNEELTTVNDELNSRNLELDHVNSDLKNLISSLNVAVVIVGRDLRIRRFSPMAERLLRIIPSDVGRPITDIRIKLNAPDLDKLLKATIETVAPTEREVQSEEGCWYSMRIRPYLTVDNKIDGAVLALFDIDAIRRSREYAESIVATVREPLLVLDEELRVRSASRSFCLAFAVSPEETAGRYLYELASRQWDVPELRRLLREILQRESAFNDFVVEYPEVGGGRRTMLLNGRSLREPGLERKSILLSIEDITEREQTDSALKESENRYRRLFESAKDGILILDARSAKITDANPFMGELLGYSHTELLGKELWEIGLFKDVQASRAAVLELQEKRYIRYEDLPLRTKAGRQVDVEFVSNLYGEDQRSVIQCNIRDMTERHRLEEALRLRNEELAAVDESKNQFIAVLSHELRSPLNVICLWSQILQRPGRSDEQVRKGLEIIDRSSKAQTRLIEDLLDVHRITSGKVSIDLAEVDLGEITRSVLDSLAPEALERGLSLEREIDSAPVSISGDATRLQQVLGNLLGNSIKFTPRGGSIRVTLRRLGASAELCVADSGRGIAAAELPRIFESFRHRNGQTNASHGGLGLGLGIAKHLAELHGGTIVARSPGVGRGTTFTVTLPLLAGGNTRPRPQPVEVAREAQPMLLRGVQALVVDDDIDAREAVRLVLEQSGAGVVAVDSAAAALAAIERRRPDVIVSDIGMPGRDGNDLLRQIRLLPAARGGRIPAIALTAYATSADRDRCLSAGFQLHMAKPAESATLIDAVAGLIAKSPPRSGGRSKK